ncbi:MAG TPA: hypothetical protein VHI53_01670 [Gaiellaceae bacterium]|nr:hypothetical protein [Gaiellaceae bacterium]
MHRLARRPSGAMVVSCIALFVALAGTSYATVLNVPRNSVGTPNLKRNAVTARKIAPNAIRTGHVLDGTLLLGDFKAGQIPQGAKGDKGDKGDPGAPGLSGVQIVTSQKSVVNAMSSELIVSCPAGKRVVGGGTSTNKIVLGAGPFVYLSRPANTNGWHAGMAASPAQSWTMTVYAICANVSS